ncbi:putative transcription factor Znf-LSD family [Helianthus annuus]|uniref:Transcription factor Znf-LSD family n=2 Tax=Helianthus annuus TaxID=4232 RepID=A0A9K3JBQ3_HELAN|nr:putative transcription factor Znf-LSD family [Helianthus annuus]KAJ0933054.1 putative transcription factor Znf-LSD family [Helianthus annuus]
MNNHEMGQMVCGSCRHLLSYPRGARYVECACCLVENYVLEEHEVGQVVCGSCNVLLMYPYGAPKVRCATCRAETEIGDQNRRPPLSEHKRRARQHLKRVQAG